MERVSAPCPLPPAGSRQNVPVVVLLQCPPSMATPASPPASWGCGCSGVLWQSWSCPLSSVPQIQPVPQQKAYSHTGNTPQSSSDYIVVASETEAVVTNALLPQGTVLAMLMVFTQ